MIMMQINNKTNQSTILNKTNKINQKNNKMKKVKIKKDKMKKVKMKMKVKNKKSRLMKTMDKKMMMMKIMNNKKMKIIRKYKISIMKNGIVKITLTMVNKKIMDRYLHHC